MFTLIDFGLMINNSVRMRAYAEALRRAVHPGSVVVDIGAGTGIFSLLACQLGARRVYAIDPNPWLPFGKETAAANGFADQIVFLQDVSTSVTLPEQADVIVSELRGRHPLVNNNIPSLNDARRRFLKPDGVMIPQRDLVYASLISAPDLYDQSVLNPWQANDYGLDLSAGLRYARNSVHRATGNQLSPPILPGQMWANLDFSAYQEPSVHAHLNWTASEAAAAHFIVIWFDTVLFEEIGFTTALQPGRAELYDCDLLPLEQPLDIAPNDTITLDLSADLIEGKYIFTWNTSLHSSDGQVKAAYQQSTFYGNMLSRPKKPVSALKLKGKVALFILRRLDNGVSADQLALRLLSEFPNQFQSLGDAAARIVEVSQLYQ